MYKVQQKGKTQQHNVMDMWKKGTVFHLVLLILIKVKQSRYRPGVAQRVPGS